MTKKQVCAIAACDYNTNLAEGDHKADLQQSLIDLMLQVTECNQCGGQCCFSKHLFDVTKPPFAPPNGDGGGDDVDAEDNVGNSLLQIWELTFGSKAKLLFRL